MAACPHLRSHSLLHRKWQLIVSLALNGISSMSPIFLPRRTKKTMKIWQMSGQIALWSHHRSCLSLLWLSYQEVHPSCFHVCHAGRSHIRHLYWMASFSCLMLIAGHKMPSHWCFFPSSCTLNYRGINDPKATRNKCIQLAAIKKLCFLKKMKENKIKLL